MVRSRRPNFFITTTSWCDKSRRNRLYLGLRLYFGRLYVPRCHFFCLPTSSIILYFQRAFTSPRGPNSWRYARLYNSPFNVARTPRIPSAYNLFQVALDAMLSSLYFVTLTLAGMVVTSPLELRSELLKRDTMNCTDTSQSQFATAA